MRRAAAVATGDRLIASASSAVNSDKWASIGKPAPLVATALAAKISTGIYSGSTSRDRIIPPLRRPTVNATPIVPISSAPGCPVPGLSVVLLWHRPADPAVHPADRLPGLPARPLAGAPGVPGQGPGQALVPGRAQRHHQQPKHTHTSRHY